MIKDNYGLEVQAKESLLNQTISGSMPMTNSDLLLKQIAKAFQLRIVKDKDRIYLEE
jgi:ferric-dicitrate binding protein FerR (iron transport regulator)